MLKIIKEWCVIPIAVVITLFVFNTLLTFGYVPSESMNPTLEKGDFVITKGGKPNPKDIIIFRYKGHILIKRVIAKGGDEVKIAENEIKVNNTPLNEPYLPKKYSYVKDTRKVPEGELFVLGDNRDNSEDSRYIGTIKEKDVLGIAQISLSFKIKNEPCIKVL